MLLNETKKFKRRCVTHTSLSKPLSCRIIFTMPRPNYENLMMLKVAFFFKKSTYEPITSLNFFIKQNQTWIFRHRPSKETRHNFLFMNMHRNWYLVPRSIPKRSRYLGRCKINIQNFLQQGYRLSTPSQLFNFQTLLTLTTHTPAYGPINNLPRYPDEPSRTLYTSQDQLR